MEIRGRVVDSQRDKYGFVISHFETNLIEDYDIYVSLKYQLMFPVIHTKVTMEES